MAGKLSYTNWVNKAKLIWGNEYDESTYKNARQKFKIYCPLHSPFFQTHDSL